MTVTVVDAPPQLQTLTANEGFFVASNCPICGCGWRIEGASRGRDDIAGCTEVSQIVSCTGCNLMARIDVTLRVYSTDKRRRP